MKTEIEFLTQLSNDVYCGQSLEDNMFVIESRLKQLKESNGDIK